MTKRPRAPRRHVQPYRYPSPDVPLAAIKRFARQIAERFQPEKIVLFGSYAYGRPHAESDVDLLVIMPTSNPIAQSVRISVALDWPFSLDLIVRTPKQIERGLREDDPDWFLKEVMEKGKVLYEAPYGTVGAQSGRRPRGGKKFSRSAEPQTRRGVLPQSAVGRKVPQGPVART